MRLSGFLYGFFLTWYLAEALIYIGYGKEKKSERKLATKKETEKKIRIRKRG